MAKLTKEEKEQLAKLVRKAIRASTDAIRDTTKAAIDKVEMAATELFTHINGL